MMKKAQQHCIKECGKTVGNADRILIFNYGAGIYER